MSNLYLKVVADENDGDYKEKTTRIDKSTLDKFVSLFDAINAFEPYITRFGLNCNNFSIPEQTDYKFGEKDVYMLYADKVGKELIDEFINNYVPYLEYGCHTLLEVILIGSEEKEFINLKPHHEWYRKNLDENVTYNEWHKRWLELYNYTTSVGKHLASTPYTQMTEYELNRVNEYSNLWLEYRLDLDKEKFKRCVEI